MGSAPSVHTAVQTRFADLDALGHVNNVTFFTYMETARLHFMHELVPMHVLVARAECDLRAEISSRVRTVDVTVYAESCGRTSFVLRHDLEVEGATVATGRVVLVKIGEDRRPTPLTDEERVLLLGG